MKIAMAFLEKFVDANGGIERVLCNFANAMTARGHEVSVLYCYGGSGSPAYPLSEKVKLYNLMAIRPGKWKYKKLNQNVSFIRKILREGVRIVAPQTAREWNQAAKGGLIKAEMQEVIQQISPDVILSFRAETSNMLLNVAHIHTPVITMFHVDPETVMSKLSAGEVKAINGSAFSQVLLKSGINAVKKICPQADVRWVPNAVPQYNEQAELAVKKQKYKIINVARIEKTAKRQHLLIKAFSLLADEFPEWSVELWGGDDVKGVYTKELRTLIQKKHLEERVFLKGKTDQVLSAYLNADIFAFPSAYEGFGMALAEAMSAGLPAVAYRSCPAVNEIVRNEMSGLLVDDGVEAFAAGLRKLMTCQELRSKMGAAAKKEMEQYAPEKVWDRWETLFAEVVAKHTQG